MKIQHLIVDGYKYERFEWGIIIHYFILERKTKSGSVRSRYVRMGDKWILSALRPEDIDINQ